MKLSTLALVSAAAIASISSIASAVSSFGSVTPTKANGDFIAGTGILANGFTLDTALTGESVGLKARDRATGQPLLQIGNRYVVSQGMASPTRAAWNFDLRFSPGANSTKSSSDYIYTVLADIDPAFGVANFATSVIPPSVAAVPYGDSYYPNGTGGSITAGPTYSYNGPWSDTTPFVISNSQNYNFGHLAGAGFTNPASGEYEIRFDVTDAVTGLSVASTTIFAQVVPEPTTLTVLAGAGSMLLRRRRA